jgi:hypothetical protein
MFVQSHVKRRGIERREQTRRDERRKTGGGGNFQIYWRGYVFMIPRSISIGTRRNVSSNGPERLKFLSVLACDICKSTTFLADFRSRSSHPCVSFLCSRFRIIQGRPLQSNIKTGKYPAWRKFWLANRFIVCSVLPKAHLSMVIMFGYGPG